MIFDDILDIIDSFRRLTDILQSLRKAIIEAPCFFPPIEYARKSDRKNIAAEVFRSISARCRAKLYRLRFSPCWHMAGGVMIRKKGRLVRRKR